MSAPLDFWYDHASTYSYLAAMTIDRRAAEAGVTVRWRPFLLGPIFQEIYGIQDSPFNLQRARGHYMWRDLERLSGDEGLKFKKPTQFPRNSTASVRVAVFGMQHGWGAAFSKRIFQLNFEEDREIADQDVIASVLTELKLDPKAVIADSTNEQNRPRLRAETEQARALGIFGAPTFVHDGEMFFGGDRLTQALAWAKSHPST